MFSSIEEQRNLSFNCGFVKPLTVWGLTKPPKSTTIISSIVEEEMEMDTNQPINLFSHPRFDQKFFGKLHSILQIHNPLEGCWAQAPVAAARITLELIADAELPPEWLKNHLTIWLIGHGCDVILTIQNIVDKRWGEDRYFHLQVTTWPTHPISLDQFQDIHLVSSSGQCWSSPLATLRIQKVSHG
ncbi:hypothetical protein KJ611_03375 [Patescibacteria group bacterium]|nr:hypothetical protein [Patescibacteria group bacterium]MBU1705469.1 hypothetical protein [Patescibacteria group bacterium]